MNSTSVTNTPPVLWERAHSNMGVRLRAVLHIC